MFCDTSTILPRFLPFAETTETGGGGTRETDTIYKHKNNVREGLQLHLLTVEDEEAMGGQMTSLAERDHLSRLGTHHRSVSFSSPPTLGGDQ